VAVDEWFRQNMAKEKDIELIIEEPLEDKDTKKAKETHETKETHEAEAPLESEDANETNESHESKDAESHKLKEAFKKIKENVHEDDPRPTQSLTLRSILGGDILTGEFVRKHIWLFVFIVVLTTAYVGIRYQCQQDMIVIDRMNAELTDAKYKALSSSSTLTEKCRESHVLDILKENKDSLLHIAEKPPYIIYVPEER
jgi:hypothetical protein